METTIAQTEYELKQIEDAVTNFMNAFDIPKLLKECNAYKAKGFSPIEILHCVISQMFNPVSLYKLKKIKGGIHYKEPFQKNTIYRFLDNSVINWHKFLRLLAKRVIETVIVPANSEKHVSYFIVDDTPFQKFGKSTELMARFFNHVDMKHQRGFRILTLAWTDGVTVIPVDFVPLSSSNPSNVLVEASERDKRSNAYKIRMDAQKPAPELLIQMVKEAQAAGIKADYMLFDSWFSTPKGMMDVKEQTGLDVIAIIKKSSVQYEVTNDDGSTELVNVHDIYARHKKRRGPSKWKLCIPVNIVQKKGKRVVKRLPAKIVFARNKNNHKDWIAIISTDTSLEPTDIMSYYACRWKIECMFKTCKQYLKFLQCRSLSFDAFTAHLAINFTRYIMLAVTQRQSTDYRSLGEIFCYFIAERSDAELRAALLQFFNAVLSTIKAQFNPSEEEIQKFLDQFLGSLPGWMGRLLIVSKNTPKYVKAA